MSVGKPYVNEITCSPRIYHSYGLRAFTIRAMGTSRLLIESRVELTVVELRAAGRVGQEALRWPHRPQ